MDEKELIQICRFYKGENENPFEGKNIDNHNAAALWFYERHWVKWILSNPENRHQLGIYVDDYNRCGLEDFEKDDGTPLSLKALLFNRFAKGSQSEADAVEDFKEFYKNEYQIGFLE